MPDLDLLWFMPNPGTAGGLVVDHGDQHFALDGSGKMIVKQSNMPTLKVPESFPQTSSMLYRAQAMAQATNTPLGASVVKAIAALLRAMSRQYETMRARGALGRADIN